MSNEIDGFHRAVMEIVRHDVDRKIVLSLMATRWAMTADLMESDLSVAPLGEFEQSATSESIKQFAHVFREIGKVEGAVEALRLCAEVVHSLLDQATQYVDLKLGSPRKV